MLGIHMILAVLGCNLKYGTGYLLSLKEGSHTAEDAPILACPVVPRAYPSR